MQPRCLSTGSWWRRTRRSLRLSPCAGKRNEPSYVSHTANVLAGIKGVSAAEIASITTANFFRLFEKAKAAAGASLAGSAA